MRAENLMDKIIEKISLIRCKFDSKFNIVIIMNDNNLEILKSYTFGSSYTFPNNEAIIRFKGNEVLISNQLGNDEVKVLIEYK